MKRKILEPKFGYIRAERKKGRIKNGMLICISILFAFVGYSVYNYGITKLTEIVQKYKSIAEDVMKDSSEEDFSLSSNSIIYASDGSVLADLHRDENSIYLAYASMPEDIINAFVAIEDKSFYQHSGVDWKATAYAGVSEILTKGNSSRGGSTITQQLVRNKYLTFERSYERKLKEIFIALEMEKKYSKEQILEYYVNNINYANGYYGIASAASGYFGKSIDKCTTAEIAFLCAIPNNPSLYNPYTKFDNVMTRRNTILHEMYSDGWITKDNYLSSLKETPTLKEASTPFYNYESSYAIDCASRYLMKLNGFKFKYSFDTMEEYKEYYENYYTNFELARDQLYRGGYTIKTSIVPDVQSELQRIINDEMKDLTTVAEDGIYVYQAAGTVIDNSTGKVIAIVGGREQDDVTDTGVQTLNRAYQAYKQPGSTIKPLIVYAPSLECNFTPDSIVSDTPIEDGPKNSSNSYLGNITLRKAVEKSKNVVAWRLFDKLGAKTGLAYAQKMKFARITPNDYFNPASLGGLYYGVTTVEMASGYATLANQGVYREPTCIVDIVGYDKKSIYKEAKRKRIYSSKASEYMTDILTGVAVSGTAAGLSIGDNMPVACKTGTTNNSTTGWFCGYTPYYSCAVYVGADDNTPLNNLWGATYPCRIWKDIEEYLCKNKAVVAFNLEHIQQTEFDTIAEDLVETVASSDEVSTPIYVDPNVNMHPIKPEDVEDVHDSVEEPRKPTNKPTNKPIEVLDELDSEPEQDDFDFEFVDDYEDESTAEEPITEPEIPSESESSESENSESEGSETESSEIEFSEME